MVGPLVVSAVAESDCVGVFLEASTVEMLHEIKSSASSHATCFFNDIADDYTRKAPAALPIEKGRSMLRPFIWFTNSSIPEAEEPWASPSRARR